MSDNEKDTYVKESSGNRSTDFGEARDLSLQKIDLMLCALITLAALFVRTVFVIKADSLFFGDLERYVFIARSLVEGRFSDYLHFHYPPLFPTLFAPLGRVLGDYETASRAVSVFLASGVVFPVYVLAYRTGGRGSAIAASAFYAFIFFIGGREQEQVLLLFIWTSVAAGLLSLEKKKPGWFFATGMLFGLAFLTKPEGWGFFLVFVVLAFGYWLSSSFRYGELKKAARHPGQRFPGMYGLLCMAVIVLAYFMITGPYLFAYYQKTGEFSFNPKARTLLYIHNLRDYNLLYMIRKDRTEYFTMAQRVYQEGDVKPHSKGVPYLLYKHRSQFASAWWKRFDRSLFDILIPKYLQKIVPWLWPLLLLAGLWNRREKIFYDLYLHAFALVPLLLVPFFTNLFPRFYFSLVPWLMIFLGRGAWRMLVALAWLFNKAGADKERMKTSLVLILTGALLYACALRIVPAKPHPMIKPELEFRKQIASELKDMLPPGCRFMAELTRRSMWYLADYHPTRQEALPYDKLPPILGFAIRKDVKFIVHHEHSRKNLRFKSVDPLLKKDFSSKLLKLRLRRISPSGKVYVIYEVLPTQCGEQAKE